MCTMPPYALAQTSPARLCLPISFQLPEADREPSPQDGVAQLLRHVQCNVTVRSEQIAGSDDLRPHDQAPETGDAEIVLVPVDVVVGCSIIDAVDPLERVQDPIGQIAGWRSVPTLDVHR